MGISVLMSVYKKEKPEYLKAALESILNQTLQPDEIVVIKDGPLTEELERVLAEVTHRLQKQGVDAQLRGKEKCTAQNQGQNKSGIVLRTYQFEENVQLGRALRKGVELCQHELIARMDTDDIACPERLQKQYDYMMAHKEAAALGGYMEEFCDDNSFSNVKTMPCSFEEIRKYARFRNPLNHMTVMLRKEAVIMVGNYRHYPFLEDYDLWSRILSMGYKIENLPEVLVRARVGNELYGRRGGFAYCGRYLKLRHAQHKWGLTNFGEWMIACAITIAVTVIPSGARKQVYQRVLRK